MKRQRCRFQPIFNRPGVAGAVLQTASSFTDCLINSTCLFTRASDSPVSAENVIYEPLVFGGKLDGACFYCLPGGKGMYLKTRRMTNGLAFTFIFLH